MQFGQPSYISLNKSGELEKKVAQAWQMLQECRLCPHDCQVNRFQQKGFCKSLDLPEISSYNPHHGEEPPISGILGSGTVFFTRCTMRCMFCQNYPISQLETGQKMSLEELAEVFLYLQQKKCHNLNLVTPTHFVPQFLKALLIAVKKGFHLPIVYNCSGYESLNSLKLLDGVVDIYLPDMKYAEENTAWKYSGIRNYPEINRKAIKEMFKQTGLLKKNKDGIAVKGLMIRHLVLPHDLSGSRAVLDFLKEEISLDVTVCLMAQYFPAYKAVNDPVLKNRITPEEYRQIIDYAQQLGFTDILYQEI